MRLLRAAALAGATLPLGASVAWAAPAWLPASDRSMPLRTAANSVVAMDEAGNTVAMWQRRNDNNSNWNVQMSTRSPGEAFSAPIDVSLDSVEPALAMTATGEAVAVWRHYSGGSNYAIQVSTRPKGGSFSAPIDISVSPVTALPEKLRVATNTAGDTVVAWTELDPKSGLTPNPAFIKASVRPAGGSFSEPIRVSPPRPDPPAVETQEEKEEREAEEAKRSANAPQVAIGPTGNAMVAWQYFDGVNFVTQAAVGPAGGSFPSSALPVSKSGEYAFSPVVAIDSAGVATAVWSGFHSGGLFIRAARRPAGGGAFSEPVDVSAKNFSAKSPAVAVSPDGRAVVAWVRSEPPESLIQASTAAPGGAFSPPVNLSEEPALAPSVAVNPAGAATVVWQRTGSGNHSFIEAAVKPPDGSFSPPVTLSEADHDAISPRVTMDGAGDATAVWLRSDGAHEIVQSTGYDAIPPELRDLSIPSSGTVGVPVQFSVNPFDVWPISPTHFSFGDGGAASGTAVSHVYSSPGTYHVTATATDSAETPANASGSISIAPLNAFTIGKLRLNKKKGTATLTVTVPGPGGLVVSGKDVTKATRQARAAGNVALPVEARGKVLKHLEKQGKAGLSVKIAFTPDGGTTSAQTKRLTLVRKLP